MAELLNPENISFGEERNSMLEVALLMALCVLVGLGAVAVCVYLAISGSLLTLDGLAIAFIALTVGAIFMANVAWSFKTGELKVLLNSLLKSRKSANAAEAKSDPSSKETAA